MDLNIIPLFSQSRRRLNTYVPKDLKFIHELQERRFNRLVDFALHMQRIEFNETGICGVVLGTL